MAQSKWTNLNMNIPFWCFFKLRMICTIKKTNPKDNSMENYLDAAEALFSLSHSGTTPVYLRYWSWLM